MIDPQAFKNVMSRWASGVTVVTTVAEGKRVGITASSFASLSLTPPQILVCVAKKLYTHSAIQTSRIFAVNILNSEQAALGMRFAGMIPELEDRFQGIDAFTAATGAPILPGVLAWLDCEVRHTFDGGDHTIFVGEAMASDANAIGMPVLYYQRQWRQLGEAAPMS